MEIVRLPKVSRRHIASDSTQHSLIPQPAAPANGVRAARQHLRLVGGASEKPKSNEELLAEPVAPRSRSRIASSPTPGRSSARTPSPTSTAPRRSR